MTLRQLPDTDLRGAVEAERMGSGACVDWPEWALPSVSESSLARIVEASDWTRTLSGAPFHKAVDWAAICTAICDVHRQADTLTSSVQEAIDTLREGNAVALRIAHTPDWLPYRSVALLPVLLNELADQAARTGGHRTVQVFLIVDSDEGTDRRMRSAAIPDVFRRNGELVMDTGLFKRASRRATAYVPPPGVESLSRIVDCLEAHIREHLKALGLSRGSPSAAFMHDNLASIRADLLVAQDAADSLSVFNTVWLSRLINGRWGLPTLFLPHTRSAPHVYGCFEALASVLAGRIDETRRVVRPDALPDGSAASPQATAGNSAAAFWLVCRACGWRVPAAVDHRGEAVATCEACHAALRVSLRDAEDEAPGVLVPRLAADALLDDLLWNAPLGVSYSGSTVHVLHHLNALRRRPVDVLWTAAGANLGAPELIGKLRRALKLRSLPADDAAPSSIRMLSGRASIVYDLLYDGYQPTLDRWRTSLRVHGLNSVPPPSPTWLACHGPEVP